MSYDAGVSQLKERATDPPFAAGFGYVYTKLVSGRDEMFYVDSLGSITQITLNGAINPAAVSVSLDNAYDGGATINIDAGPVTFSDDGATEAINLNDDMQFNLGTGSVKMRLSYDGTTVGWYGDTSAVDENGIEFEIYGGDGGDSTTTPTDGGTIQLVGGQGGSSTGTVNGGPGGSMYLDAGTGGDAFASGTSTGGTGGEARLDGGDGGYGAGAGHSGGDGGRVDIIGGAAGGNASDNGGAGGIVNIWGGDASSGADTGQGGDVVVKGGTVTNKVGFTPAHTYILGGARSGLGSQQAGHTYIRGGAKFDSGTDGHVYIGDLDTSDLIVGIPLQLTEQGADPVGAPTGAGYLYTKDPGATQPELFFMSEDGTPIQITPGGGGGTSGLDANYLIGDNTIGINTTQGPIILTQDGASPSNDGMRFDDDMVLIFGTGSEGEILYDETTNDALMVRGSVQTGNAGFDVRIHGGSTTDANTGGDTYIDGGDSDSGTDGVLYLGNQHTSSIVYGSPASATHLMYLDGANSSALSIQQTSDVYMKFDTSAAAIKIPTELRPLIFGPQDNARFQYDLEKGLEILTADSSDSAHKTGVFIEVGDSTNFDGGVVDIRAGVCTDTGGGSGGSVEIRGGYQNAGSGGGGGGAISILAGDSVSGPGGEVSLVAGGSVNSSGGVAVLKGGTGYTAGSGGHTYVQGGPHFDSTPGNAYLLGGKGSGTDDDGGNAYVRGGGITGTGTPGNVYIGDTDTSDVIVGMPIQLTEQGADPGSAPTGAGYLYTKDPGGTQPELFFMSEDGSPIQLTPVSAGTSGLNSNYQVGDNTITTDATNGPIILDYNASVRGDAIRMTTNSYITFGDQLNASIGYDSAVMFHLRTNTEASGVSRPIDIHTAVTTAEFSSGTIRIYTGTIEHDNVESGAIDIFTGDGDNDTVDGCNTGAISIHSGNYGNYESEGPGTGNVSLYSGDIDLTGALAGTGHAGLFTGEIYEGNGTTGNVSIYSGEQRDETVNASGSGTIQMYTGECASAKSSISTGAVWIYTGARTVPSPSSTTGADSGAIKLYTGDASHTDATSGSIEIYAGAVTTGIVGDVIVRGGASTGAATVGGNTYLRGGASTLLTDGIVYIGDLNTVRVEVGEATSGSHLRLVEFTTTERDAIASPLAGAQIYNTTTDTMQYYDGAAWADIGGGGTSGLDANYLIGDNTIGINTTQGPIILTQDGASPSNNGMRFDDDMELGFGTAIHGKAFFNTSWDELFVTTVDVAGGTKGVRVRAGDATTGNGGGAFLDGGASTSGSGGSAYVNGGSSTNSSGGGISLNAGGTTDGTGGNVSVQGGGVAALGTGTPGTVTVRGGVSQASEALSKAGNTYITGGLAVNRYGGDAYLRGGAGPWGNGTVSIGDSNTSAINIGATGITTSITSPTNFPSGAPQASLDLLKITGVTTGNPTGAAANGCLAYDETNNLFFGRAGGSWVQFATGAGGGNTLDGAYDEGGAGVGRSIAADTGGVQIIASGTSTEALDINIVGANGIDITQSSAPDSGNLLKLTNAGLGKLMDATMSNVSSNTAQINLQYDAGGSTYTANPTAINIDYGNDAYGGSGHEAISLGGWFDLSGSSNAFAINIGGGWHEGIRSAQHIALTSTAEYRVGTNSGRFYYDTSNVVLESADSANAVATHPVKIETGQNTSTGNTGNLSLLTGLVAATATTGSIQISSGQSLGAGTTGSVTIETGGTTPGGTANSGDVIIRTGSWGNEFLRAVSASTTTEQLRIGGDGGAYPVLIPWTSDPAFNLAEGGLVYNGTSKTVKFYNGSAWISVSAAGSVGLQDAYLADNSIEMTSAGGAFDVSVGSGTAAISLDSNENSNLTMTANVAATKTLTVKATNLEGSNDGVLSLEGDLVHLVAASDELQLGPTTPTSGGNAKLVWKDAAPAGSETGYGRGTLWIDMANGFLYINTNDHTDATWQKVGQQS